MLDEHTREALGSKVARSIGSYSVRQHLEKLFAKHGTAKYIRADNGREFIGEDLQLWLKEQGVEPIFIAKASPTQNCYIERFNGSMRRELLNGELFHSVLEAKVVIDDLAPQIASWLIDLGSGSVVSRVGALDRHWRNIKVIASHNPRLYKERLLGQNLLTGQLPPSGAFF